jgi:Ca2+/Na+ antiporter
MAAGASAPELLTSFVSIFITHSSLGMGTIVGSEIFNQLCIGAGSILAARNHQLHLSPAIVLREIFFYALSLVLLLVAIWDRRYKNDDQEHKYIYIQWADACFLLLGYCLYVLVCAYYDRILEILGVQAGKVEPAAKLTPSPEREESIVVQSIPFLRQLTNEPNTNFDRPGETLELAPASSSSSIDLEKGYVALDELPQDLLAVRQRRGLPGKFCTFLVQDRMPKLSALHGLEDHVENKDGSLSCFLWQQSVFYSKARVDVHAWQLMWFTFLHDKVVSVPDRYHVARFTTYPSFELVEVDELHLVLRCHTAGGQRRNYILMAPTKAILERVSDRLGRLPVHSCEDDASQNIREANSLKVETGPSIISYPFGSSPLNQLIHIFLYPLKLLIHVTVPDPRQVTANRLGPRLRRAVIGVIMCVVWLIIASYAMCTALEHLGLLMRVPISVLGVTVSAAGTSLPIYVASVVASRQGLGNQAISNAFGSNSFNIFVGLGLPWVVYTSFYGTYDEMQDDEILMSVAILGILLFIFLVLVFFSRFVLHRWHAYLFFILYALYLVYAVGQIYLP